MFGWALIGNWIVRWAIVIEIEIELKAHQDKGAIGSWKTQLMIWNIKVTIFNIVKVPTTMFKKLAIILTGGVFKDNCKFPIIIESLRMKQKLWISVFCVVCLLFYLMEGCNLSSTASKSIKPQIEYFKDVITNSIYL